jgi:PAS domain S-box-containing protein
MRGEVDMRGGIFRGVRAYIVAVAVVGIVAALVSTIFFTQDNLPWTAFLTGILVASVLAEAARASRSEWVLMRRTAQLSALKDKLELEKSLRKSAEEKIADAQVRLRLIDETLLTMIVLIDTDGHCRYHNRAFRDWLHLKAELINGRPLRELFGSKAYAGIATAVQQSLDGQPLRYEYLQEMPGGAVYRLSVEHVPQFDAAGRVTGFYFLAEDITQRDV